MVILICRRFEISRGGRSSELAIAAGATLFSSLPRWGDGEMKQPVGFFSFGKRMLHHQDVYYVPLDKVGLNEGVVHNDRLALPLNQIGPEEGVSVLGGKNLQHLEIRGLVRARARRGRGWRIGGGKHARAIEGKRDNQ